MEQYFPVGCIKKAKQMADSLSLLPDLELYLFDDSEVKTDDIVSEDVFVFSAANMRWNLNRFHDHFEYTRACLQAKYFYNRFIVLSKYRKKVPQRIKKYMAGIPTFLYSIQFLQ